MRTQQNTGESNELVGWVNFNNPIHVSLKRKTVVNTRCFSELFYTHLLYVQLIIAVMLAAGLDGASGSNTKCLSYIKVYGELSNFEECALRDLESRFRKRMSEFLKLNNASLVDVTVVGSGSITVFFLLPLEASLRLWEAWRNHPRSIQSAMRGLVYNLDNPNDPIPVIYVGSTIGIRELHLIKRHRSQVSKRAPAAESG